MDLIGDDLYALEFEKNVLLIQHKIESAKSIARQTRHRSVFCDMDRIAHKKDLYNSSVLSVNRNKSMISLHS